MNNAINHQIDKCKLDIPNKYHECRFEDKETPNQSVIN